LWASPFFLPSFFPTFWQPFAIYISLGVVTGFLGTLDELPKFLALIILVLVVYNGPEWMAAIAPQWHSTQSEPALAMMGGMAAVGLAYVHRPIRK
jgi:amino acid transporter